MSTFSGTESIFLVFFGDDVINEPPFRLPSRGLLIFWSAGRLDISSSRVLVRVSAVSFGFNPWGPSP